jgi:hypothetical protein
MTTHDLKIWPDSFTQVWLGKKRGEFRRNDRDFHADDILILREWQPATVARREHGYTGHALRVHVTHVQRGPDFGIPEGFAVLSIELIEKLQERA